MPSTPAELWLIAQPLPVAHAAGQEVGSERLGLCWRPVRLHLCSPGLVIYLSADPALDPAVAWQPRGGSGGKGAGPLCKSLRVNSRKCFQGGSKHDGCVFVLALVHCVCVCKASFTIFAEGLLADSNTSVILISLNTLY